VTSEDQVWPSPGFWRSDPAHTYIGFVARHLMVQKLRGRFDVFDVGVHIADPPEDSEVRVELDSASVRTGSPDRDIQLRSANFLDVESFPRLTFESTEVTYEDDGWRVVGDLTVRDRTSPVALAVTFLGVVPDPWGGGRAAFKASTEIERGQWGLTWNLAIEAGLMVSRKMRIEIASELVPAT
jgi:polyisoprenoid-binding protein YceI